MRKKYQLTVAVALIALCLSSVDAAHAMAPETATKNSPMRPAPRPKGQMIEVGEMIQAFLNLFSF